MGIVIQSVANYAPWIYAICGMVALYQLYKIWAVRAERKQAVFSLEREKAINDTYSILAIALILLITMGATYFVSTTLREAVEPLVNEALTPTPPLPALDFLVTPTNTPLPVTPTPTRTATPPDTGAAGEATTPEATEEAGEETPQAEVATPTPTPPPAPVVVAPTCPDQRALLIRPGQNEIVSGDLNVIGSATHDNFQFYKIEAASGASAAGGWQYLGGGNAPVVSGFLTTVNTRALTNGVWTLQLVVVDQIGNFIPPCQVTVTVQN
jgi:hypothetical protein